MKINWHSPNILKELPEYIHNPSCRRCFESCGFVFTNQDELLNLMQVCGSPGQLTERQQSVLENHVSVDDLYLELFAEDYAKSFKDMEKKLLESGEIDLPMPIAFVFESCGRVWGFAGNRRQGLARKYKIPVTYWIVTLRSSAMNQKLSVTLMDDLAQEIAGEDLSEGEIQSRFDSVIRAKNFDWGSMRNLADLILVNYAKKVELPPPYNQEKLSMDKGKRFLVFNETRLILDLITEGLDVSTKDKAIKALDKDYIEKFGSGAESLKEALEEMSAKDYSDLYDGLSDRYDVKVSSIARKEAFDRPLKLAGNEFYIYAGSQSSNTKLSSEVSSKAVKLSTVRVGSAVRILSGKNSGEFAIVNSFDGTYKLSCKGSEVVANPGDILPIESKFSVAGINAPSWVPEDLVPVWDGAVERWVDSQDDWVEASENPDFTAITAIYKNLVKKYGGPEVPYTKQDLRFAPSHRERAEKDEKNRKALEKARVTSPDKPADTTKEMAPGADFGATRLSQKEVVNMVKEGLSAGEAMEIMGGMRKNPGQIYEMIPGIQVYYRNGVYWKNNKPVLTQREEREETDYLRRKGSSKEASGLSTKYISLQNELDVLYRKYIASPNASEESESLIKQMHKVENKMKALKEKEESSNSKVSAISDEELADIKRELDSIKTEFSLTDLKADEYFALVKEGNIDKLKEVWGSLPIDVLERITNLYTKYKNSRGEKMSTYLMRSNKLSMSPVSKERLDKLRSELDAAESSGDVVQLEVDAGGETGIPVTGVIVKEGDTYSVYESLDAVESAEVPLFHKLRPNHIKEIKEIPSSKNASLKPPKWVPDDKVSYWEDVVQALEARHGEGKVPYQAAIAMYKNKIKKYLGSKEQVSRSEKEKAVDSILEEASQVR